MHLDENPESKRRALVPSQCKTAHALGPAYGTCREGLCACMSRVLGGRRTRPQHASVCALCR